MAEVPLSIKLELSMTGMSMLCIYDSMEGVVVATDPAALGSPGLLNDTSHWLTLYETSGCRKCLPKLMRMNNEAKYPTL